METIEKKLLDIRRKIALIEKDNIELLEYENLGYTNWLLKNTDPIFYDENMNKFDVDLTKNQKTYISYYEPNHDFTKPPKNILIELLSSKELTVVFNGEKDDSLECNLLILEYVNGQLSYNHEIPLNSKENIRFNNETNAIRMLIKLEGYGSLKINELIIGEKNYWNLISLNNKNGFIHYSEKNWLIPQRGDLTYDKEIDAFSINSNSSLFIIYGNNPESKLRIKDVLGQKNVEKIFVEFYGNVFSSDLEVELCIHIYNKNEKVKELGVPLNRAKTISIPNDSNYFKIMIKVCGSGLLSINNINISGINLWPKKLEYSDVGIYSGKQSDYYIPISKDNSTLQQLHRNKITYSIWNGNYYSELKGNQSVILKINDHYDFKVVNNKVYEFNPVANKSSNVELLLIIKTEDVYSNKKIYYVPFNNVRYIEMSNVRDVSFFIKIQGEGNFSNLGIYINEQDSLVTQSVDLDLSNNAWYPGRQIELFQSEILSGKADIPAGENRYISYKENNSSFNILPSHNVIRINKGNHYVFNFRGQVDNSLQVLPMVIGYDDVKKIAVYTLKLNSQTKVKFKDNITRIRIAFRLSGVGQFSITSANIYETPILDIEQFENYSNKYEVEQLNVLPPRNLKDIKIAAIVDEFTEAALKKECKLIQFTPQNWLEVLSREQPDILFVESAWQGYKGTWNKKVGYYGEENNRSLFDLINWCKSNNIPTVFWNKEDPVHFSRFIEIAKHFDYVFTTDKNMVPKYIKELGHENVDALPFAAQPLIHNPIKLVDKKEDKACFAGSYYHHHKERSKDMNTLLDAASKFGLDIYDRNYEKTSKGLMPNHTFPDRFKPFIKGTLKYYEIDKAYKGYKVSMNVNTVKDSETMFSRRVFESLACGTPVVSNYSKGLVNMLGKYVTASDNYEELKQAFDKLLNDKNEYEKVSLLGMREVLRNHTYSVRLKKVLDKVGINIKDQEPSITIIGIANSPEEFENIIHLFKKQKYKNKELYILIDTFEGYLDYFNKYNCNSIKTFIKKYVEKNYNNISELVDSQYFCYFNPNDFYGENYLLDLSLATKYTDADFIGKRNYYRINNGNIEEMNPGSSYEFVNSIHSARTLIKTNTLNNISLSELISIFINKKEFENFYKKGKLLFSCDKFNYIENGFNINLNQPELFNIEI